MRLTHKFGNEYDILKDKKVQDKKKIYGHIVNKLGQLEDIEDRLSRFSDIGIDGLITLFKNLDEDDLEFIVQRAFKSRRVL